MLGGATVLIEKKIDHFLQKKGAFYGDIPLGKVLARLEEEMERGLGGQESSVAMLPTYLRGEGAVPGQGTAVVLDAGGTHLRTALVRFRKEGGPLVERYQRYPMVGTMGKEVGKKAFFETLAESITALLPESSQVGFCFSYPTEAYPDGEAVMLNLSKELRVPEVVGVPLGEHLKAALCSKGYRKKMSIVILNDTVATLLAGMTVSGHGRPTEYLGGILGTGFNLCYVEENTKVIKARGLSSGKQIINTEIGAYAHFPRGEIDAGQDRSNLNQGEYFLEKMVSGRYFGALVTEAIRQGIDEGLFSSSFEEAFRSEKEFSTREVSEYLLDPRTKGNRLAEVIKKGKGGDGQGVHRLSESLLERAACAVAVALAGGALRATEGSSDCAIHITMEGTAFYAYPQFSERVCAYLDKLMGQIPYAIAQVRDAPLVGAAVAALRHP